MFQIVNFSTNEKYNVYSVREVSGAGADWIIQFLVYRKGKWTWVCSDEYYPI